MEIKYLASRNGKLHLSIAKKLTFVLIVVSVLPASILGLTHILNLNGLTKAALEESSLQMERKARESLELRAVELAGRVGEFLQTVETDAKMLCFLPKRLEVLQQFYAMHKKTVWTKEGTNDHPVEVWRDIPLYREIAFVDVSGRELIKIASGYPVKQEELRDISQPENTTYKSENYFLEVMKLPPGGVYVSHVTGWFVSLEEQLNGANNLEKAVEGKRYEGVVRFAVKCSDGTDGTSGVIVLSLDHRHLMEFTMHILPTEERFVAFPSYSSGNYAFMFDDEGWIISHPKYCDIRSLHPDGSEFNPLDPYYYENLIAGKAPFHLDYAGMINENYPFIASEVRKGHSGVTRTFNVGGIPRVMAYAPVRYNSPPYDRYGIFGGITIGVEISKFKEPIAATERAVKEMLLRAKMESFLVLVFSILISACVALALAKTITKPIRHLAQKAVEIAGEKLPEDIVVRTGDELESLSENLSAMAHEIHEHRLNLERSLEELTQSKKNLEQYSHELERQIWIIKNIHSLSQLMSIAYRRDDVLGAVLRTAVEGLGYDRAILYLFDPKSRQLVCKGTYRFSPEHEKIALSFSFNVDRHDCALVKVFRTGKTVFVEHAYGDENITELDRKIALSGGSNHLVWAPMKSRDKVIGVLGADRVGGEESSIGTTEIEALEILAGDAARAIEHSELYWQLVKEKNFVTLILAQIPLGVVVLDGQGRTRWFNPYAERFFGLNKEEVEGKHFLEAFKDFPSWRSLVGECLEAGCSIKPAVESTIIFPDGKEYVIEYSSSVLAIEKLPERNLFIFFQNITSKKEIEEHLRRTDRLASLGVLAAGIAHEIRNPLTGISLMMDDLHDRIQQKEYKELIRRSLQEIERLEDLINGLLDFARPSGNLNIEKLHLSPVVADTLFFVRKLAKNSKINIITEVEESLPPLDIDRERIKQVFLNLFLNAIQAMASGGTLSVRIFRVKAEDSMVSKDSIRTVVSDTGKGIDPQDLPYIFDPFFSRRSSGCGLGLAIAHTIITEHGGIINVASVPGEGSSFYFDIPIERDDRRP